MSSLISTAPELRSEADSTPQEWQRLCVHLAAHGMTLQFDPLPRQFAGGLANLNYLLTLNGTEAVLRRPPMGQLPPGAYDMAREFRILSRLWSAFPLAPRALHLCEDKSILGAPFQIIEYRRGFAVRSTLPQALRGSLDVGSCLASTLAGVLAQLHAVDPAAIGLGDLGHPEGFLKRAVEGWAKRAALLRAGGLSAAEAQVVVWLRAHEAPGGASALVHNDLKLDNILLHGTTHAPVAVLDWDQGTRADALFDLATTLSYWVEPDDPPVMLALQQMPTAEAGFPSRREFAELYARLTGRDLSDFRFYRVLAIFKLAVIFQQLHHRYRQGATSDPRYADFGRLGDGIVDFALTVARGEIF